MKWSEVQWSEVKCSEMKWREAKCDIHAAPTTALVGAAVMKFHLTYFSRLKQTRQKSSLVSRTEKKRRFREMPNRNGAIYNRLRGTKREKKEAQRHFGHSRLRPLGLFSGDFQEKSKRDKKALVGRARSQQQLSGFAGAYFP